MRYTTKILGLMWHHIVLPPVLFGISLFMLYGEITGGGIVLTLSILLTIDTIDECYWWSDIVRRWPSI